MKNISLLLLTLLWFSCSLNMETKFSLSGKTKDIKNGTVLYLYNTLEEKIIDSAQVSNNRFEFDTELTLENPLEVVLHNKDYTLHKLFWIEDNEMTFDAITTSFKNAKISGSETEDLRQELLAKERASQTQKEILEVEKSFIEEHKNSILSIKALSIYAVTLGKDETIVLYNKLSDHVKNSEYSEWIESYIKQNKETKPSGKAPDFEMESADGKTIKLSDYSGKVVLLEFWASWCIPCKGVNTTLVDTYKKYQDKDFEILAVSLDMNEIAWKNAIEKNNLAWQHVSNLKGSYNPASLLYGIDSLPYNFLINRKGDIVAKNLRDEKLDASIKKVLKK